MESLLAHQRGKDLALLRVFVGRVVQSILSDVRLPNPKIIRRMWKQYWGRRAFSDCVSQHGLDFRTRMRKAFLWRAYRCACDAIRKEKITAADTQLLAGRLSKHRPRMHPAVACVALAIDAALARLWHIPLIRHACRS